MHLRSRAAGGTAKSGKDIDKVGIVPQQNRLRLRGERIQVEPRYLGRRRCRRRENQSPAPFLADKRKAIDGVESFPARAQALHAALHKQGAPAIR